jgi:hypothetical protein
MWLLIHKNYPQVIQIALFDRKFNEVSTGKIKGSL